MGKKPSFTIVLTDRQKVFLDRESQRLQISTNEVIRRIIDNHLDREMNLPK